jgi:hypothetical protein
MLQAYKDFTGGLSEVAPDIMLDTELTNAQNTVPAERGGLSKCKGTVRVNAAPFSATGIEVLIEYGKSDGTIIPLAFSGTTVRKWDGTVLKSDLPGVPTDWDIYNDILYWLDGTKFWQYDGTTISEVQMDTEGDPTTWNIIKTCHFIEQRGQRHFFAKKNSNSLYYSEVGKPNCIKAANVIKAVTDDADKITGLKEFANALLVFKRNSIFSWTGWDPAGTTGEPVRFDRILVHKGTVSHHTIQRVDNYLLYLADDGVYALQNPYPNMISSINLTDNKISNIIKDSLNQEKACAVYYDGAYRLSICTEGTVNNAEYRFYSTMGEKGAWFGPYTHPVACYLVRSDGKLYSGHPSNGLIFEHENGYNYDGQPIHMIVETKPFDPSQGFVYDCKYKKMFVAASQYDTESSTTTVYVKVDYKLQQFDYTLDFDESLVWSEGIWSNTYWGWVDFITKEIKLNAKKGKRIQVKFENNTVDQPVTIYGIAFLFKPKKAKGNREGITEQEVM